MTEVNFSEFLTEFENVDINSLVRRVHKIFRDKQLTLSVAESVTGGMIAARITAQPGGAVFFSGGAVCYQPKAKYLFCGVDPKTIAQHGAVSPEVTKEMASGIKKRLQTDIGLAVTGVAGPEPGSFPNLGLPGITYISVAKDEGVSIKEYVLHGTRDEIRESIVKAALSLLVVSTGSPLSGVL